MNFNQSAELLLNLYLDQGYEYDEILKAMGEVENSDDLGEMLLKNKEKSIINRESVNEQQNRFEKNSIDPSLVIKKIPSKVPRPCFIKGRELKFYSFQNPAEIPTLGQNLVKKHRIIPYRLGKPKLKFYDLQYPENNPINTSSSVYTDKKHLSIVFANSAPGVTHSSSQKLTKKTNFGSLLSNIHKMNLSFQSGAVLDTIENIETLEFTLTDTREPLVHQENIDIIDGDNDFNNNFNDINEKINSN
jgi:hypothetical protein